LSHGRVAAAILDGVTAQSLGWMVSQTFSIGGLVGRDQPGQQLRLEIQKQRWREALRAGQICASIRQSKSITTARGILPFVLRQLLTK